MTIKRGFAGIFTLFVLAMLFACTGAEPEGNTSPAATGDFPVDEPFAAALKSQGLPEDVARFFAAAKLSSNCASDTTCTHLYTYPNGATRKVTITAIPNQQYTPTAVELTRTASVTKPVYDGKFAASGIEGTTPAANAQVDISYFVPTTSIPVSKASMSSLLSLTAKDARPAPMRAPGSNDGFTLNLTESGAKGADVAIGSILEHYKDLGKSVEATGSLYALASALSDVAGAMAISKEIKAWLDELDALEKCASDPTNSLTQSDPDYSANTVAKLRSTRAELKQISAVRFINIMGETGAGIHPATAVLSIPLKQANAYTEQTLKNISEQIMQDARSSVVSCKPTCPTNLTATGVSESQIDLSWSGSIGDRVVTGYIISGGNANSASTTATVFSDTGLTKSTTYCYTVSAYNDYGTAENCPQACGQTMGPPLVYSTTPYADQIKVAVNTAVTATFSEAMDATTINSSTFTLAGTGGVTGTVSYSGKTATFTPSGDLEPGKKYTATITTGVTDTDGIAMEANFTWSFTTIAAKPAGNLQFDISVGGGAVTATGTADVTWTEFEDLGDVRRYVPSGTITADITLAGAGCDTLHATVPIEATVPGGPGGTLVVYTGSNVAYANSYQFALAADQNTYLSFSCTDDNGNKFTLPSPAPISIMVGLCESTDLQPLTNEGQLAGSYSCLTTGLVNVTWDFTQ